MDFTMADILNGLPHYNLTIDPDDDFDGVSIMSFVERPAVDKDFLALSKEGAKAKIKLSLDEEKRLVTGVALRADYPILREENGEQFTFSISAAEVEKIMHKFMKELRGRDVNTDHDHSVQGVYLVESYLFTQDMKYHSEHFYDIEVGSWMVTYKVENDEVWSRVKAGQLNGFSVEVLGLLLGKREKPDTSKLKEILGLITLIETK